MKRESIFKNIAMALLVLGVAVGCSGTMEKSDTGSEAMAAAEQAIADAKATNSTAKSMGAGWRDTDALIKRAEKMLAEGDTGGAIRLAQQAKRQAENGIAQMESEKQRNANMMDIAGAGESGAYTVVGGDSLWRISGRNDVYANPYMWPLIYKANSGQIKDADLIFPGQTFAIDRGASTDEVGAAVSHARNRGAWSVGEVEQSDINYLAR